MSKLLAVVFLLTFISCGTSTLEVDDSQHTATVEGEAYTYVVIKFDFITQIKKLCSGTNPLIDFNGDKVERRRAVADCTFDNLSILDTGLLSEFNNGFCAADEKYGELSNGDKLKVDEICEAL